jgi:hypothetical protein
MSASTHSENQLNILREQIFDSLEKAQAQRRILKRNNVRYTTANIVLGAIATVLAGTAGTVGSLNGWKPICLLAAACSAGATVAAKFHTSEQLSEASECVGQLKALRVEVSLPNFDLQQVSEEYQHILSEFSTIDC